ncbi:MULTISPECIES: hypothetical protein [unclassified Curtobacterium]|uniref:hypothetical protein n=1 Tax=unclassified Curtobacterium TaxID=257496 RepID=UPI00226B1F5C|nr:MULTISPECIES: hypothetical protein [unclassified Curtobacterium]
MPKLRRIAFWPTAGSLSDPWFEEPERSDVALDRFLRASRSPAEAFSALLEDEAVDTPHSSSIGFTGRAHDGPDVTVLVERSFHRGGEEGGVILIPMRLREASSEVIRVLAGEALVAGAVGVAELRALEMSRVLRAAASLRQAQYRFAFTGPWKSSRDRKTRVRLEARIADDGFARLCLRVARDGAVNLSAEFIGSTTIESIRRASRSVRWISSEHVQVDSGAVFDAHQIEVTVSTGAVVTSRSLDEPRVEHSSRTQLDLDVRIVTELVG